MPATKKEPAKEIARFCDTAGIVLLVFDGYLYGYSYFDKWGWTSKFTDRLLGVLLRSRLFNDPIVSVSLGIVLLIIGTLFRWNAKKKLWNSKDPFGVGKAGFPQEHRCLKTPASLNTPGRYRYKGQKRRSWINLVNPYRGIMIMGTPGAGKSRFVIEPLIRQLAEKGMALFVYDLKHDALSRLTYAYWLANREQYPAKASFFTVNFTDLSRSHRCNVLQPGTLSFVSDAIGVSKTILLSLNPIWAERQGDFFVESAVNYLAALIWWLRAYENGKYCTLPHVIELSKLPYDQLFSLLGTNAQIAGLIHPFLVAYTNESTEMLDGQLAGAKVPLARLASPDLYFVLTGNDFQLDINNPQAPKIFCLGGDASRLEALTPVISLYIDRINRLCNKPGKYPCALVCDEFATVRTHSMLSTLATARSNQLIPIMSIQDISQLRTLYSRDEADALLNMCGNVFCGQAGGETARWISERFPKIQVEKESVSGTGSDNTTSRHLEWEQIVTPATVAGLSSGEFLGIVADEPGIELPRKIFHARLERVKADRLPGVRLPVVRTVEAEEIRRQFEQIRMDIGKIVGDVMKKIMDGLDG